MFNYDKKLCRQVIDFNVLLLNSWGRGKGRGRVETEKCLGRDGQGLKVSAGGSILGWGSQGMTATCLRVTVGL